jgi:hypothetical protein
MTEYLEKHKLKTKEDIAQHIVELKRNTYPDMELISSLCSYLFDGEKTENKGVLNDHIKEVLKDAGTKDHGEVKPNSTRHKAPVHCGGYSKPVFERKKKCSDQCFCDGSCKKEIPSLKNITEGLTREPFYNFLAGEKKQYTEPLFKDNPHLGENTYTVNKQETEDFITTSIHIKSTPEQAEKIKVMVDELNNQNDVLEMGQIVGKKENKNKIDYSEIDWDIIDLIANRFNDNKHKYPKGNMLKPIDEKELLMALFRHWKKMIQPIEGDEETFEDHLSAILCNAQMIYQQRKLNKS